MCVCACVCIYISIYTYGYICVYTNEQINKQTTNSVCACMHVEAALRRVGKLGHARGELLVHGRSLEVSCNERVVFLTCPASSGH